MLVTLQGAKDGHARYLKTKVFLAYNADPGCSPAIILKTILGSWSFQNLQQLTAFGAINFGKASAPWLGLALKRYSTPTGVDPFVY